MENTVNTTPEGASNANSIQDNNKYLCTIQCAIRRKPGLIGIPGQDPAERVYKLGASLDLRTKGNLKGISGDLEAKFMPEIVGVSPNDATYRRAIEEYWSSVSTPVPADEPFLKDYKKGVPIEIRFHVVGKARKERMDSIVKIEEKIELLNKYLITNIKDTTLMIGELDYDSISDYLLLNYSLKYSKVANTFEDIDKSPKIEFYIFEKAIAVQSHLNLIELRAEAMACYQLINGNEKQIDATLLHFEVNLADYDNVLDKLLKVDEEYNSSPAKMQSFVTFVKDDKWEIKYVIAKAIAANKLKKPMNTSAVYYGDVLLGTTLEDAVLYLINDEKGQTIYTSLVQELTTK